MAGGHSATAGMSAAIRMPADFEPQSAIVVGCNELLPNSPQLLLDLLGVLLGYVPVIAIVNDEAQRMQLLTLLCDWGLSACLPCFISLPVIGTWVRDYGPGFVYREDGDLLILDAQYFWQDRPDDDRMPTELAGLLRVPVRHVPWRVEGGNILSNGQGLCITTHALLHRNGVPLSEAGRIADMLHEYYGFEQCVFLRGLLSEHTGHVDMFATFLAPDLIAVGQYDPAVDPVNSDVLDENAAVLAATMTRSGPLRVVRIPMPSNRGSIWRTYTNVLFAGRRLIVPVYPPCDPERQAQAIKIFRTYLPDHEIIEINANEMIQRRGALRCATIAIPRLDRLAWLGQDQTPTLPSRILHRLSA